MPLDNNIIIENLLRFLCDDLKPLLHANWGMHTSIHEVLPTVFSSYDQDLVYMFLNSISSSDLSSVIDDMSMMRDGGAAPISHLMNLIDEMVFDKLRRAISDASISNIHKWERLCKHTLDHIAGMLRSLPPKERVDFDRTVHSISLVVCHVGNYDLSALCSEIINDEWDKLMEAWSEARSNEAKKQILLEIRRSSNIDCIHDDLLEECGDMRWRSITEILRAAPQAHVCKHQLDESDSSWERRLPRLLLHTARTLVKCPFMRALYVYTTPELRAKLDSIDSIDYSGWPDSPARYERLPRKLRGMYIDDVEMARQWLPIYFEDDGRSQDGTIEEEMSAVKDREESDIEDDRRAEYVFAFYRHGLIPRSSNRRYVQHFAHYGPPEIDEWYNFNIIERERRRSILR